MDLCLWQNWKYFTKDIKRNLLNRLVLKKSLWSAKFICSVITRQTPWGICKFPDVCIFVCYFGLFYVSADTFVSKACLWFSLQCTWNRGFTCRWTWVRSCSGGCAGSRQTQSHIVSLTVEEELSGPAGVCSATRLTGGGGGGALISSCHGSLCREEAGWCNAVCAAPESTH